METYVVLQKVVFVLLVFLLFPTLCFAATLFFTPASGTYTQGQPLSLSVYVGSQTESVNAASGVISFPRDLLEVTSISKNQSIVSLWVQEPSFSNSNGTVNFEGIMLNPGFTGQSGKILTINFRVKTPGRASISFASGSVLANDGAGTDVLSKLGIGNFTLVANTSVEDIPSELVEPASIRALSLPAPAVLSTTHPHGAVWSKHATGTFTFLELGNATALRLLVDDEPISTPTVVYAPPIASREIEGIQDGISYLHIQYKTNEEGWGEILHYKLQVDTQIPSQLRIREIPSAHNAHTATFIFSGDDALSGIAYYDVAIDGGSFVKFSDIQDGMYTTGELPLGNHELLVHAYDKAGNFLSTTTNFVIQQSSVTALDTRSGDSSLENSGVLKTGAMLVTVLSIVIPFVALVLLLLVLLYSIWRSLGGLRRHVEKEVLEAKMIVHKAFALLRNDLQEDIATLENAHKKRKLTKEESKILKRLRKNIDEAEKVISREIEEIQSDS